MDAVSIRQTSTATSGDSVTPDATIDDTPKDRAMTVTIEASA
jgi:hypothetical protein